MNQSYVILCQALTTENETQDSLRLWIKTPVGLLLGMLACLLFSTPIVVKVAEVIPRMQHRRMKVASEDNQERVPDPCMSCKLTISGAWAVTSEGHRLAMVTSEASHLKGSIASKIQPPEEANSSHFISLLILDCYNCLSVWNRSDCHGTSWTKTW